MGANGSMFWKIKKDSGGHSDRTDLLVTQQYQIWFFSWLVQCSAPVSSQRCSLSSFAPQPDQTRQNKFEVACAESEESGKPGRVWFAVESDNKNPDTRDEC
ncbi:hypothetical protein RUM44_002089 [Polyplax serrata]|uniref:Uncharacterized protein n=1 Tax=Polyplax serrata TaxID=468196 RepID=A0ABR1AMJ9_POLSC